MTENTEETGNARDAIDFEAALKELETLVTTLEQGDQTLEASLRSFERGVTLTRQCQQALQAAEQKVETLLGEADDPVPFQENGDD